MISLQLSEKSNNFDVLLDGRHIGNIRRHRPYGVKNNYWTCYADPRVGVLDNDVTEEIGEIVRLLNSR
jgi:hypothetical protein